VDIITVVSKLFQKGGRRKWC